MTTAEFNDAGAAYLHFTVNLVLTIRSSVPQYHLMVRLPFLLKKTACFQKQAVF